MNTNEAKITMDTMKKRLMTVNEVVKKLLANEPNLRLLAHFKNQVL